MKAGFQKVSFDADIKLTKEIKQIAWYRSYMRNEKVTMTAILNEAMQLYIEQNKAKPKRGKPR